MTRYYKKYDACKRTIQTFFWPVYNIHSRHLFPPYKERYARKSMHPLFQKQCRRLTIFHSSVSTATVRNPLKESTFTKVIKGAFTKDVRLTPRGGSAAICNLTDFTICSPKEAIFWSPVSWSLYLEWTWLQTRRIFFVQKGCYNHWLEFKQPNNRVHHTG